MKVFWIVDEEDSYNTDFCILERLRLRNQKDVYNLNINMLAPKGLLTQMCVSSSNGSQWFLIMKANISRLLSFLFLFEGVGNIHGPKILYCILLLTLSSLFTYHPVAMVMISNVFCNWNTTFIYKICFYKKMKVFFPSCFYAIYNDTFWYKLWFR